MADRLYFRWIVLFALMIVGMLTTAPFLFGAAHAAPSTSVVISQVYGGGGNSGATFKNDFIELFNRGALPVTLTNWTVQYAPATGSTWYTTTLTGTIAPGQYFLIKEYSGGTNGSALPASDITGTINLALDKGKVALVDNSVMPSGSCPTGVGIIDFDGYGSELGGANCFEGDGAAATLDNTMGRSAARQRLPRHR